jgi:hypothetical protein
MTRYRIRDDVKVAALAGEGVVLHLDDRRYFTVNPTALVLLQALAEPKSRAELRDALMEHFEVSADRADEGVDTFLKACERAQFLVRVDATQ